MPTECSRDLFGYELVEGRQVVAAFDGGAITSDAGALLLGATDRAIGLVGGSPPASIIARPRQVEHSVEAPGGAARLRHRAGLRGSDRPRPAAPRPGAGRLVGKLDGQAPPIDCAPLAGKSTLNRLEHARRGPSRYQKIGPIRQRSRACSSSCSSRPTRRRPRRSSSTSTPPTTRCTATRRAASSTATTRATATCRCTSSAATICSRPSCGPPTSTPAPAPRRSARSSARSVPAWPRVKILLRADSGFCPRGADDVVRGQRRRLRLRSGPQRAPGRGDRRDSGRSGAGPRVRATGRPVRRFADFA